MDNNENQKEKLTNMINALGGSISPAMARKIDIQQLNRVGKRLVQYFDECDECKEHTASIVKYMESINDSDSMENNKALLDFKRNMKSILSHMQNKHKLIIEGHFMSIYMSAGLAVGAGLGAGFGNIAMGISMGMLIGAVAGLIADAEYRKKGLVL